MTVYPAVIYVDENVLPVRGKRRQAGVVAPYAV